MTYDGGTVVEAASTVYVFGVASVEYRHAVRYALSVSSAPRVLGKPIESQA